MKVDKIPYPIIITKFNKLKVAENLLMLIKAFMKYLH
jgi:hypothetical protein